MLPAIKTELLKYATVRSTYVVTILAGLFVLFISGYGMTYTQDPRSFAFSGFLDNNIRAMLSIIALFCGIVAILQFSHEYRFSTITYTLTAAARRSQVMLAKIIVASAFALGFTLLMGLLTILATYIGAAAAGHALPSQVVPYTELVWQGLFTGWGYALLGAMLVGLFRNQVLPLVVFFLTPIMVEPLLAQVFKGQADYFPFRAMGSVLGENPDFSAVKAVLIFLCWLVGGWIIAWLLFLKRDAN